MAKPLAPNQSYVGFIRHLIDHKDQYPLPSQDADSIAHKLQQFQPAFFKTTPVVYLLDYTQGKYIHMSAQAPLVFDHKADYFLNGGLGFTFEQYQPEDLKLFSEQIFPDRLAFLNNVPVADHSDYLFSYNFRWNDRNGNPVHLVQRNCFIQSDRDGKPLLSLGMVINMDHYTANNHCTQLIEKLGPSEEDVTELIFKRNYYPNNEDLVFSKREREVLQYMSYGLTSKEIAHRMFLSEHTIIQHKRNMHNKTAIPNATALVSFALRHDIIK